METSIIPAKGGWSPIGTNMLADGTNFFSDSQSSNYPFRFYRLRAP